MATEKAAKPAQPTHAAEGPCLAASTAPVAQPDRLPLMTSCLPRHFSKRQSQPEKSAVMT